MKPFLFLLALCLGAVCEARAEPTPAESQESLPVTVRPTDLDQKGHVNNARYLEYLQCGRWAWLESHGLSNDAMERDEGTTLVVVNVNVNYRRAIRYGDQITVLTGAVKKSEKAVVFRQAIQRDGEDVADADVTMVAVDLGSKRSRQLPASLTKKLSRTGSSPFRLAVDTTTDDADTIDVKAVTIHLDDDGTSVSVAKSADKLHLMLREVTKDHTDDLGIVALVADSGVKINKRQSLRLVELMRDTIRRLPDPESKTSVQNDRVSPMSLVANRPGYVCGPNGCYRVNTPPAAPTCGPNGCPAGNCNTGACAAGGCATGNCGQRSYRPTYSRGYSRPRLFRGRFGRCRGCR